MKSGCLNVFQRNNYVVIKINEGYDFEVILKEVRKRVTQLKKIYKEGLIILSNPTGCSTTLVLGITTPSTI